MQKTRLGITVGLLGAAMYLSTFFGGFVAAVILAGYILLLEENIWLKKAAVKAVALTLAFSLLSGIIGLLPNAIDFINSVANLFDESVRVEFITNLVSMLNWVLVIAEKVLFILLGIKALNQGNIKIPVIDPLINKHMG